MNISINTTGLEQILTEIKNQSITIDVFLNSKEWSGEYCEIEEIKQLITSTGRVLIMILKSPSGWQLIPLEAIEAVRLNRSFTYSGEVTDELTVSATAAPLALHA